MGPDKTLLVAIPKTLAAKTDNLSGLLLTFLTMVNYHSTFFGPTDLTGSVFGDKIILEKSTVMTVVEKRSLLKLKGTFKSRM